MRGGIEHNTTTTAFIFDIFKKNYSFYFVESMSVMQSNSCIDVNTATIDQLESLVGVGRSKAETILEIRKVRNMLMY